MTSITKVSDITVADLADYLHLEGTLTTAETGTLTTLLAVAKSYIQHYTGKTAEEIDAYADLVIVVLILVQDMFDTRTMYPDKSTVNRTVESILALHEVNLL